MHVSHLYSFLSRCSKARGTRWSILPGCSRLASLTQGTLWSGVSTGTWLTLLTSLAWVTLDATMTGCCIVWMMVRTLTILV